MKILKWLASFYESCFGDKEIGVKVGVDLAKTGSDKTVLCVSIEAWNKLVGQKLALEKKLEAAAEALQAICLITAGYDCLSEDETEEINILALDGYRAAK